MFSAKTLRNSFASSFALSAANLLLMASLANGQAYSYRWDNGGGNNSWGTGTNWGLNPPLNLGSNNFTPSAFYEEMALINNGNTVNVTTSQTQFNGSGADNVVAAAGVTVDGVTPAGNGSRLNIASGGNLSLLTTYGSGVTPPGPPGTLPTAGTGNATINNLGAITVQPGGTLSVKANVVINSGTLTIGGAGAGGTVTAGSLIEAGTNSALNLLGSATLNLANGAVLAGTTTITGPNVVFNTPGIGMNGNTVFSPVITSNAVAAATGHSVINVAGGVVVNGTLRPQFQGAGVAPHLGDTWTLWDSAQTLGSFTVSDATGAGAALPTGLRYALTTTKVGSVNGTKGQLTVENFLTAEVNRANGQVTIRNTNTTVGAGVTIDGYQIASPAGALKQAAFTSPFGGAWQTANLTANSIGELNSTGNSVVGLGATSSLGSVYDPVALQSSFGTTPVSDLTFSYTRSDGRTVNAPVTYVNNGLANTLVLQVDPATGNARIVNDSIFDNVEFEGYQVTSASNSLRTTWTSLQDQTVIGWQEAAPTTGSLAELNSTATTTVDAGQIAAVFTGLFQPAGGQDLQFVFRVAPNPGDYNSDGNIDAADYTVWRDTLGSTTDMRANGNNTGASAGTVDAADYAIWKSNFGNINGRALGTNGVVAGVVRYQAFSLGAGTGALGSSQVPEPSAFIMAAGLISVLLGTRCRFNVFVRRQVLCRVPAPYRLRGLVS